LEILVDTSVWIDFFNGIKSVASGILYKMLEAEDSICISDIILAETLQGFRSDEDFESAKTHLLYFPVYSLGSPDSYIKAAQLYRMCRKKGITIRKTIDCLIAQTAIEHHLVLLHRDKDFDKIASVSGLRVHQP
jgi:predicted nucleic acid-binding protein